MNVSGGRRESECVSGGRVNVLFKCREGKEGEIILVKCGNRKLLF